MNIANKIWVIIFHLILISYTSTLASTKGSEIPDYLGQADKVESVDHKLYLYKKVLALDPNNVDALIGRGSAYTRKALTSFGNDFSWRSSSWFREHGFKDLNRAIELAPNSASAFYERGLANYYAVGRVKALPDYNRAIELDATNPKYYLSRSYAYDSKSEMDRKLADIERALTLDKKLIGAHLAKAAVYADQNKPDRALVEYKEAIAIDPNKPGGYASRGNFYDKQGNVREAISDYNRAIELAPRQSALYERRASLHRKLGEKDLAESDDKMTKELKQEVQFFTGMSMGMMGDGEKALSALDKAIALNPWDFSNYIVRGVVYGRQGTFNKALIDLDRATEIGFDLPDPFIFRSKIYGEMGRYDDAIADLKKACDVPEGKCEDYQLAIKTIVPYRGQVIDRKTRKPIPGAYIVIKRTGQVHDGWSGNTSFVRDYGSQYGISDERGRFEMPPISKRPVLPDIMGREIVTYIKGIYRPGYSTRSSNTSMQDPGNVIIELDMLPDSMDQSIYFNSLQSHFANDKERMELRKEDFAKAIDMLRIWEPLVVERVRKEIASKIKELQLLTDKKNRPQVFLYNVD